MTDDTRDPCAPRRTRINSNRQHVEYGIDYVGGYVEGYRVTVGWSDEDDAWVAEVSDPAVVVVGRGPTHVDALCMLVCALASAVDALSPEPAEPAPDTKRDANGQ